jgi:hypothetical protein
MDAAARGRADAETDVAAGTPHFVYIGMERAEEGPLDPETGLVRRSVACCKTYERIAYCEAYNRAIDAARTAGRLEGTSLAAKATTRAALEAMFAGSAGVALTETGPAAAAPGGRYSVEIALGRTRQNKALWLDDAATGLFDELRFLGGDSARVLFSKDGTTLYVRDDRARVYETIDLPTAQLLQVFPDPERRR